MLQSRPAESTSAPTRAKVTSLQLGFGLFLSSKSRVSSFRQAMQSAEIRAMSSKWYYGGKSSVFSR